MKKNKSRFEFPLYLIDGSQHTLMVAVADTHVDSMVGKVLWTDKWSFPPPLLPFPFHFQHGDKCIRKDQKANITRKRSVAERCSLPLSLFRCRHPGSVQCAPYSLPEPARIKHSLILSQTRSCPRRLAMSLRWFRGHESKNPRSRQHPLTPSFDVLIEHDADICQDKPTDNEAKEFRCVSGAQFESDMDWRGMP